MHERLRLELLRRVNRGAGSVSRCWRARRAMGRAHLPNFYRAGGNFSLEALGTGSRHKLPRSYRICLARISPRRRFIPPTDKPVHCPNTSHTGALFEPCIRPCRPYRSMLHSTCWRCSNLFTRIPPRHALPGKGAGAVRICLFEDAVAIEPLVMPEAMTC